jgi:hypothetical protein
MKKTALTLLALAGLVLPASALANVTTSSAAPTSSAIPVPNTPPPQQLPCWSVLDTLVDKLKSDEYRDSVDAHAMVMHETVGYAESCRAGGGGQFCSNGRKATFNSVDELVGTTSVTEYSSDKNTPLSFRLDIDDGVAKIKWRFKGKSYSGNVDACTGGYWTATTSNSAIVVKVESPVKDDGPPR